MADDVSPGLDRFLKDALPAAGPCPDENVLSALAEGRLEGPEHEAAVSHVAACEACRDVVRALAPHVERVRARGRLLGFSPRLLAAAAAVLLALGAGIAIAVRGRGT